MRRNVTPAVPSRRPPHSHHPPPSAPAASPANAKCQQPPSHSPPLKTDTFRWSIVIPAISLALLARSLVTALRQASAAGPHAHPPPSFQQLLLANFSIAQLLLGCLPRCLVTLILAAACSAATLLAPSWYLQGGREQLLAVARLLPKAITVLQLLLLPSHPLGELQRVWLQTCIVGAKGLLAVMIWPAVFPTPVRSYLKLAPLECGLALAADCMFTFRTSSPPAFPPFSRIATLALLYVVCGFALPAALLMCNHPLQRQRRLLVPLKTTTSLPQATCTTPSDAPAPKTGPPLDFPLPNCHEESAAAPALQPPAQLQRPPQSVTPFCSTVARLAAVGATAELSSTPSGGPAPHSKCSLYRSRNTVKVLSIKIHDHQAYPCREAILASITATLQTPQATSPTILLTTCAVEGCLQLLITASTLDGTDHSPLPFDDNPGALFAHLHSQLPASCRNGLVTFHMDDTFQAFEGSSGQQLPAELLHLPGSDGSNRLQWSPVCFEAGLQEEVEVELTCGMMAEGAEAVVQCRRQGVEVVEKLPLRVLDGRTGTHGRLLLPTGLDPGPVAIYLLSTQEGRKGVVLGSATTMALPPPAAAELQDAHNSQIDQDTTSQAEYQSTMRELLRDYATCWQLPGSCGEVAQAASGDVADWRLPVAEVAQMAAELLQYLSLEDMPACCSLLSAHCMTASASAVDCDDPASASKALSLKPPPAAAAPAPAPAPFALALALAPPPVEPAAPGSPLWLRGGLQWWPASWIWLQVQRLTAHWAHLQVVSSAPGFAIWKLQQAQWVDSTGWVVVTTMSSVSICLSGKRLLATLGFGMPWVQSMAFLLLQFAPAMVAHMLLAVAGEGFRRRREAVVLVFAAAKAAGCMLGVCGWLQIPGIFRAMWGVLRTAMVVHGLLRPCLLQVSWKVQLLVSSMEEAGRYAALTAAPHRWGGAGGAEVAQLPSWQYARLSLAVVVAAVASSSVMEAVYLLAYSRHVAALSITKQAAVSRKSR